MEMDWIDRRFGCSGGNLRDVTYFTMRIAYGRLEKSRKKRSKAV